MRRLVTDNLLSLDGYSSGPNDEIDWFGFDEESLEWSRNLLRGAAVDRLAATIADAHGLRRTYDR